MDSLKPLSIAGIIKETIKIFFINGKLMPSITLFSLLIYSILYISNTLMADLFAKLPILLLISIFFLITKTFTLFVFISTISASSILYSKKDLPFNEFFSRVLRSWKKPLVTLFYTYLLNLGYMYLLFLFSMFALTVIPKSNNSLLVLFLLCTMIMVLVLTLFYIYLDVIWTLGLVVSVLEENCYGFEAFWKAKKLIKGRKLQGFRLALLFTLISIGVMQGVGLLNPKQSGPVGTIIGLLVTNSNILVEIFELVAFTLFYYECKKIHGEEVVAEEGYTKLPNTSYATSEDVA